MTGLKRQDTLPAGTATEFGRGQGQEYGPSGTCMTTQ